MMNNRINAWLERDFSLAGIWSIKRSIRPYGYFIGTARVESINACEYYWEETGQLKLKSGTDNFVTRCYRYRIDSEKKEVVVYFADGLQSGKILHRFDEDGAYLRKLRDTHKCLDDIYRCSINIHSDNQFTMAYIVSGPRKLYSICSMISRIS